MGESWYKFGISVKRERTVVFCKAPPPTIPFFLTSEQSKREQATLSD